MNTNQTAKKRSALKKSVLLQFKFLALTLWLWHKALNRLCNLSLKSLI